MSNLFAIPTENAMQTTLSSNLSAGETGSLILATNYATQLADVSASRPGIMVIDRVDSDAEETPNKREYIKFTGVSSTTVSGLTRGMGGSVAQSHTSGAIVEFVVDADTIKSITDTIKVEHNSDGTHNIGPILAVVANSAGPSEIRVAEDTDNGNNYISLKAPSSIASNLTFTLPSADGTSGQVIKTDGSGTLSFTTGSPTDAWTDHTAVTWTYSSASAFTIAGTDLTSIFTKGTRLRVKQGGSYKYLAVASSSFSTNTTVNILVNTDYTLANASITDNYYSYAANPQGWPTWFAYSPTVTGTTGTGIVARYLVLGNSMTVVITYTASATGSTTAYTITTPVVSAASSHEWYGVIARDTDAGSLSTTRDYAQLTGSSSTLTLYKANSATGWTASGNRTAAFSIIFEF